MSDFQSSEWKIVRKGRRKKLQSPKIVHQGVIHYETTAKTSRRSRSAAHRDPQFRTASLEAAIGAAKELLRRNQWWTEVSKQLEHVLNGSAVAAVQCLGIGSYTCNHSALHQLACALLLKEYLSSSAIFSLTDPAMTDDDLQVARKMELQVVPYEDFNVAEPADGCSTILFMPHCGLQLYEAVFAKCSIFHFKGIIFLGNMFSKYEEGRNDPMLPEHRRLRQICSSKAMQETPCPSSALSTREFAFNDLAITTIKTDVFKELVPDSD